jgi:hypothetical protein
MNNYSFPAELNLELDVCRHDQYIWGANNPPPHNIKLTAYIGYTARNSIRGPDPWVDVFAEYSQTGPYEAFGSGTVAGYPNIPVQYRLDPGAGALNSLDGGVYRMGVEGADTPGHLPPCDDDNNPNTPPEAHAVYYRVKAKPTATPTLTSTPTPQNTPPDICIAGANCTPTATPTGQPQPFTPTPTRTPTGGMTPIVPTPTRPPSGDGDCNHDGSTNAVDALLVLQYTAGLIPHPGGCGNVNGDGVVNAIDANLIFQYIADFIDRLPWP